MGKKSKVDSNQISQSTVRLLLEEVTALREEVSTLKKRLGPPPLLEPDWYKASIVAIDKRVSLNGRRFYNIKYVVSNYGNVLYENRTHPGFSPIEELGKAANTTIRPVWSAEWHSDQELSSLIDKTVEVLVTKEHQPWGHGKFEERPFVNRIIQVRHV